MYCTPCDNAVVALLVVFVVSCNWFFPANHKSVSVLFLFTCILYCIAFLLLHEAFLRMRIPSMWVQELYYFLELVLVAQNTVKFLRSIIFVIFVRCKLITKILSTKFFSPMGVSI